MTEEKQIIEEQKGWTPYSDEEYLSTTQIALPRFIKVFRGKFQQIFNKRLYAFLNFSMSLGEILIFLGGLGFIGYNIGTSYGNQNDSGNAASIPLMACLVFTVKNSLLTFICGISYERGIFWHKIFGWVAAAGGLLHFFSSTYTYDGWFLLGSIFGMLGFSLWPIRIYLYEIFIRFHWIGFVVVAVGIFLHGVGLAMYALGYWGLDFFLKQAIIYRNMKNCKTVQIEQLTSDMVKIIMEDSKITYQGGQYLTVCIPKISYFEWHPFSIQTEQNEKNLEIYCKVSGNWTKDLLKLSQNLKGEKTQAFVCGPYGFPSIDIAGDYYKSFILIAGGIGITPIISTLKSLLQQRKKGRPITQIYLIWTTRSYEKYEELLSEQYINSLLSDEDKQVKMLETFYHCSTAPSQKLDTSSQKDLESKLADHNSHFITSRPNLKEYFENMKGIAKKYDEKRIGVMVCGPSTLISSVQDHARSISNLNIRFDVHEEVFNL